jgi:AcrR family transcriptional regulator
MGIEERKDRERSIQRKVRRRQIMGAAKKIFAEKGFSGATMEDIAREAELGIGTLYLYFSSKDELYAAINVELQKYMQRKVQELADNRELSPPEKVTALSKVLYKIYEYDPSMMRNVLHLQASDTLKNLTQDTIESINGILAQTLAPVSKIITDGMRQGFFKKMPPVAVVDVLWAMFSGLVLWEESKRMFDPKKNYLRPTLDLAMKIIGQGIAKGMPSNRG